jgi:hypothetical protein
MNINNRLSARKLTNFCLGLVVIGFLFWLIVPNIIKYKLYSDTGFYLALGGIVVWLCIPVLTITISKRLISHPNKQVILTIAAIEFSAGIFVSIILGDVLINQGSLLFFIYALLPFIAILFWGISSSIKNKHV